jgi:hypothetical protein
MNELVFKVGMARPDFSALVLGTKVAVVVVEPVALRRGHVLVPSPERRTSASLLFSLIAWLGLRSPLLVRFRAGWTSDVVHK